MRRKKDLDRVLRGFQPAKVYGDFEGKFAWLSAIGMFLDLLGH